MEEAGNLMENKEVINWQFVDKYYDYLNKKIQLIDYYRKEEAYELGLSEMEEIFIHINGEIKESKECAESYQELNKMFTECKTKIKEYQRKIVRPSCNKATLIYLTGLKNEIGELLREIYLKMMATISKLNMFFPKVRKEAGLPIYRS